MTRRDTWTRTLGALGLALICCGAILVAATGAIAAPSTASDWARDRHSVARLVSAVAGVGEAEELAVGVQIVLEPGWKTYWRSPGDAGAGLSVDWDGSENLAAAKIAWPAPERFSLFGLDTIGYERAVVFPIAVRPVEPGRAVRLRAAVSYQVCEGICVPVEARLALDVPAGPALPSAEAHLIARYAARVPGDGAAAGLTIESVTLGGDETAPEIEIVARAEPPFEAPDLFVEGPTDIVFGRPETVLAEGGDKAVFRVPVERRDEDAGIAGAPVTLTLVDGGEEVRALERRVRVAGVEENPLPAMALSALLGGFVLNFMPCVLPVLALKLLGFVDQAGAPRGRVRLASLAAAAGILASFLLGAAVLVLLKSAGAAVGWGIQFQQPTFLVGLALLLTLFACNLWGWFEIPLPGWVGSLGAAAGRAETRRGAAGLAGHFATGGLAALLATPCSAPFLGTAVGFALAGGAREILTIFVALGLGFASPYLLVAAVPDAARLLPKPGRWTVALRCVFGFALAATAAWLMLVVAQIVGPTGAGLASALLVAVAAILRAGRRVLGARPWGAVAAASALALAAPLLAPSSGQIVKAADHRTTNWQTFNDLRIAPLVEEGRVVVVDVTAAWCITCQVNKRLTFEDPAVIKAMEKSDVAAMRADWTRPDDAIARYLARHGRYGVPFDVVYGPGAPDGIVLPELLTSERVLEAIQAASADPR